MKCPKCSFDGPPTAKFCVKCGEKLSSDTPEGRRNEEKRRRTREQAAAATATAAPATVAQPKTDDGGVGVVAPIPRRVLWVGVAVIVALVAIVLILVLAGRRDGLSQQASVSSSSVGRAPTGSKAGEKWTGPDGGTYVWVPEGEFSMGSSNGDSDEKPVHNVRITKGFWLSKYEVTNAQ